jgi:2-polyprenyl-3-methyl-5-hydroxy-6-metoxy-1,4-benzoquinol methylase
VFRDPFPSEASLAALYETSWIDPDENKTETGATDAAVANQYVKFLSRTVRQRFSGKRILDFGAGRGAMSLALRAQGADVVAVDPFGRDYLARIGLVAYRELSEVPSNARFDGVVSLEVLEHLVNPRMFLEQLHDKLRPEGWLFVTTPNAAGLPAKLNGARWREVGRPGHILFFTPRALKNLLPKVGFDVVYRPCWLVRYPDTRPLRAAAQIALQALRQDGSLRLVAYRR